MVKMISSFPPSAYFTSLEVSTKSISGNNFLNC